MYRRVSTSGRLAAWVAPLALAAAICVWDLLAGPSPADLAAATFRSDLFAAHGFTLWDNAWYAGHHVPGYSVLSPAFGALLTPRLSAAVCLLAATALTCALLARRPPRVQLGGGLLFAAAMGAQLATTRIAFTLGVVIGLGALLAYARGRDALAIALALLTPLGSPVAGLGLALLAAGAFLADRRATPVVMAGAALLPVAVLAILFPEGGTEPFPASRWWPVPLAAALVLAGVPRGEKAIRWGAVVIALATTLLWLVASPVGATVVRISMLAAGPVAAIALAPRRPAVLGLFALPIIWWAWQPAVRDISIATDDPAIHRAYYAPLLAELGRRGGRPARVEVVWTRNHWEDTYVAPRFPLPRGWERQLDMKYDAIFFHDHLTRANYREWLRANAVRWVALPDAKLDSTARREARYVRAGLPYLREVWRGPHWRLYAVRDPVPLASGAGRVTGLGADTVALSADRPGPIRLRVRWTPYWAVTEGSGCVRPDGGFTAVDARRAGRLQLGIRFSLGRIRSREARCAG